MDGMDRKIAERLKRQWRLKQKGVQGPGVMPDMPPMPPMPGMNAAASDDLNGSQHGGAERFLMADGGTPVGSPADKRSKR